MAKIVDTLVEMGFSRARAELAISKTSPESLEAAMEWLLSNEEVEETDSTKEQPEAANSEEATTAATAESSSAEPLIAKSIKCEECGKLFTTQTEVEFHSAKSGHENYSESTEEKKALTEEEKKEQLAKIEAKLRQRRLEREAREKQEELDREKNRIRSGKEMLEAKKKHEDMEIKKMVEQRKREKEEERLARQRVREQIEQDKLMRKVKFGGSTPTETIQPEPPAPTVTKPAQSYDEVQLQIKLTNGKALVQKFKAKEPLSAVKVYVELNRTDEPGPFNLMINFPKKVFSTEDYDKPLDVLGLAPSAVLIVTKSQQA